MVETKGVTNALDLEDVTLNDLEDAAHVPHGSAIKGAQPGNWMWRSPEAHAGGPIEKPSDMFSFGIVVNYPQCSSQRLLTVLAVHLRHGTRGHLRCR